MSPIANHGVLKWPASIPARFQKDVESLKTWFNAQIAVCVLSGRNSNDFWEQGWLKAWLHVCLTSDLAVVEAAKSTGWKIDTIFYLRSIQRNFCIRAVDLSVFKVTFLPGFRTSRPAKSNNRDFQATLRGKTKAHKIRDILVYTDFGGDWNMHQACGNEKPKLDHLELVRASKSFKIFGMPDVYKGDYAIMNLMDTQLYILTSTGHIYYWATPSKQAPMPADTSEYNDGMWEKT